MLALTFVQCTYNDIPETNRVPTVQCCSCSVFTVYGTVPTCNVICNIKHVKYWYISAFGCINISISALIFQLLMQERRR